MYDIYSHAMNDAHRFTLGKSGQRKLLTIGLNPSTATKEKSDTTVAKVAEVARQNGFDGFVMLNLYPVRATDFKALPRVADEAAYAENLKQIETVVALEPEPIIWAAWGKGILAQSFFVEACIDLFAELKKYPVTWQRFGPLTGAGHPRHPSRLKYAWQFAPMEMGTYVCKLRA